MTGNLMAAAPLGTTDTGLIVSLVGAALGVAVYCWYAAALAALFAKVGAPRWKAWVPIVSQMEVLERVGRPAWHVLLLLVPVYGLVVWALALHRINQSFGRGGGYTVLGMLLPPVWASVLGWGPDQPDFEPQRMYQTMAPSMGRGPLAAPDSVPMWAGAPMAATANLAPGQPWAPAAPLSEGPAASAASPIGAPDDFPGYGPTTALPDGLSPVLSTPVPGQTPDFVGQPALFSQPGLPAEPVYLDQAVYLDQPVRSDQPVAPSLPTGFADPAVFGLPVGSDQPVMPGQPVPGPSAGFGDPALFGLPGGAGQPVAPGQPLASDQPWSQEQAPWTQPLTQSTPGPGPSSYAPRPVDLASYGQPDPAPSAPSNPASTLQTDMALSGSPYSVPTAQPGLVSASSATVPGLGPAQEVPVPDPRFAAVPPVAGVPDLAPVPLVPDDATPTPSKGVPGLGVGPAAPPPHLASVASALTPLPAPEPVHSLPATSLPAVAAPVPLTLVGSSDAQQTMAIPPPDEDIDGTVVVRRPTFQPWVLSLDDGRTFVIRSRSVILGRRPESVELGVQLLAITDDGRTISKTHARIDLVDDVWRVVDLGSTNGVVATDVDGEEIDVEPGKATPVYGRLVLGAVGMRLTPGGDS